MARSHHRLSDTERIARLEQIADRLLDDVRKLDHALSHVLTHVQVAVRTGSPFAPTPPKPEIMTLGAHYARTLQQQAESPEADSQTPGTNGARRLD